MTSRKRSKKPKRIAVAIGLDSAEPWHHDCYQGVLNYAHEKEWRAVVDPLLLGVTGEAAIRDYDGVVGRISAEMAETARAHDLPVVNHWRNSPIKDIPTVGVDYEAGAVLAAEHLVAGGYRRMAFIDLSSLPHDNSRVESLNGALAQHGIPPAEVIRLEKEPPTHRDWLLVVRQAAMDWLKRIEPPVGVLVRYSHVARYLAQICEESGIRVPQDVGLVVDVACQTIDTGASPTLSAVQYDFIEVGYQAARLLDQLMKGKELPSQTHWIAPRRLVVRESSDMFVFEDPLIHEAMKFIAAHCRQTLKVEDVVAATCTSERTLRRRFEEVLGRSVRDEIVRLRIEYLKRLLMDTDKSMSTIADDCGFSSPTQFTRFFSQSVGQTPSEFRTSFAKCP